MICENNLFIKVDSVEKKDYFLSLLNDSFLFFESFIPFSEENYFTCYGTNTKVYIDDVVFDITYDQHVINCIFKTDAPCINFCIKLAGRWSSNIQLTYYNDIEDYSGQFKIYRNQIVKNDIFSYWQGMYIYNFDLFWELLESFFGNHLNFEELVVLRRVQFSEKHFMEIKREHRTHSLIHQFERM
jgi:hypothetical protein